MMLHNPFSTGLAYYSKSIIRSKYSCLKLHKRQKHSKLLSICSGSRTCWNNQYVILTSFVPCMWSSDCVYIYCRKCFCFLYFCLSVVPLKWMVLLLVTCLYATKESREQDNPTTLPINQDTKNNNHWRSDQLENLTSKVACLNVYTGHIKIQNITQNINPKSQLKIKYKLFQISDPSKAQCFIKWYNLSHSPEVYTLLYVHGPQSLLTPRVLRMYSCPQGNFTNHK